MVTFESIKSTLAKPALAGAFGGTIITIGHAWRPFVPTTIFHGAMFSFTVALVANLVRPIFTKLDFSPKTASALAFTAGVITAVSLSIAAAYMDITTSDVSRLGVIVLTLASVSTQYII